MKISREQACELLTYFEKELSKVGWHVALGGSCLYAGESSNDIDVIVYKHKPPVAQDIGYGNTTVEGALLEFGQALFKTEIKNVLAFDAENLAKITPDKEPTYAAYVPTDNLLDRLDVSLGSQKPFYSRAVVVSELKTPFQCFVDWFVMIN